MSMWETQEMVMEQGDYGNAGLCVCDIYGPAALSHPDVRTPPYFSNLAPPLRLVAFPE